MPKVYEYGIDKTTRCYVRIPAASEKIARGTLKALVNSGPLHLIDDDQSITYTDRADDAPRFDLESVALVNVEAIK